MEVFVPFENFPSVYAELAVDAMDKLIDAAMNIATMRRMKADGAMKGIDLPEIDGWPYLGSITDKDSPVCKLARELIDKQLLDGTEGFLADTPI